MKLDTLEKLFVHELKDLHSAERQLLEALPDMEKAASSKDLKKAFSSHRKETQTHVERIEKVFGDLEFEPGGHRCKGMEGLIEEATSLVDSEADEKVRDAGLITAAQRVEHYEIAGYGSAVALAERLGKYDTADLLRETLEEEGRADRDLSHLASRHINAVAMLSID